MTDIVKTISQLVESQFPQIYREDAPTLIQMMEAYYEYMEQTDQSIYLTREMFNANDIDRTLEQFLSHFKAKYLDEFPFVATTDKRFLVKNILDFYSAKGSEASIKLLMRLLFQEDVEVYLPGQDILKPSDSKWSQPIYLELSYSERTLDFVNKQVRGSVSNATAIVESITTKRINGRLIDILYISNLKGNFRFGEFITDNLTIEGSPRVLGSLTNIEIANGGQDNKIGDILNIVSNSGRQGKVRVTSTVSETGRVDFQLVDGGAGYALNGIVAQEAGHSNIIESPTDIFVSDNVLEFDRQRFTDQQIADEISYIISKNNPSLSIDNQWNLLAKEPPSTGLGGETQELYSFLTSFYNDGTSKFYADINGDGTIDEDDVALAVSGNFGIKEYDNFRADVGFINFEKVVQHQETISLISASDVFTDATIGVKLVGIDGTGAEVANSVIIEIQVDANDSTRGDIIVQPYSGTFGQQAKIELAASTSMTSGDIGDIIEEASVVDLTFATANIADGPFIVGDIVLQLVYVEGTSNTALASYATGTISNVGTNGTNTTLTIDPAYGEFVASNDAPLTTLRNDGNPETSVVIPVGGVDIVEAGATGRLSQIIDPTTIVVDDISGAFTQDKFIKTSRSNIVSRIQNSIGAVDIQQGAVDVYLNGLSTSNGVITDTANTSATGFVTGQDTKTLGIHGVTGTFRAGDVSNNISREEIALQVLRIAVGLDTPSESKYQALFDALTANNNALADIDDNGDVTAFDALQILKGNDGGRFDEFIAPKFYISTVREELVSPPRDENGQILQIENLQLSAISSGINAGFDIGSIENEETVFLNTDLLGGNNAALIPYLDVTIEGSNSSIGFIDSIDVIHTYAETSAIYVVETVEPSTLQLDETFTSENAAGIIVDNTWEIYDSNTAIVTSNNKIVVQVSSFTGAEPFTIGDTITGDTTSNSSVVYRVQKLAPSLAKDIFVYQGSFANAETANTDAALVSAKLSDWRESDSFTKLYLKDVTAGTVSDFDDNEAIYVLQQPSPSEKRFIRLGTANCTIVTADGYSNNESSVLEGGGFAGGEPIISGVISVTTDASSTVTDLTVIQPGLGYYESPTVDDTFAYTIDTYPGPDTALNQPLLNVYTNFGYGFPKQPQGDSQTPIEDMLTTGDFTIGTITSLTSINPGSDYNANPFINIYNRYVAGFKRGDFAIDVQLIPGTGQFDIGETVTQTVSNVTSIKGTIKSINDTTLEIERLNFNVAFAEGVELVGVESGTRANIVGIEDRNIEIWGTNAIVTGDVIVAAGVATGVEVIDSGFGYLENESVTMIPANNSNSFVATGVANLENQGIGSGFWKTFNSHLNSNKKIRDSVYYQEFSYDVISGQSLDKYEDILKKTLHVAGTRLFGSVSIESEIDLKTQTTFEVDEIIEVLIPLDTQQQENLDTEGGLALSSFEKRIRAEV